MEHSEAVLQNHRQWHRLADYLSFCGWVATGALLAALGYGGYWLYGLYLTLSIELLILVGVLCAFLCALTALVILLATTMRKMLYRAADTELLRFDVYHAVKDGLVATIMPYLPGIRRLETELSIGEALNSELGRVSERYARLQTALTARFKDTQLPDAIHQLVKNELAAQNLAADNEAAAAFLQRHDATLSLQPDGTPGNIRHFPQRES